jgi:putative spermidine/putrescine transport system permease protein
VILLAVFVASLVVLAEFSFHRFSEGVSHPGYTTSEWARFLTTPYVWDLVAETVLLGLITTAVCALIGYATALALHRITSSWVRAICYFALFSPLLTSVVARTYGWSLVLGDVGFVNAIADRLRVPGAPFVMMYEREAVVVALVHILLPFMVLPIVSSLRQIDPQLPSASADLGASAWTTLRKVVFPLSVPGLIAGCQLTFALTISAFATPSLLGGGRVQVLATNVYSDVQTLNWPRASVGSFVLLVLALISLALFAVAQRRLLRTRRTS